MDLDTFLGLAIGLRKSCENEIRCCSDCYYDYY